MQPAQLRRLHALWRRWTARLGLPADQDRHLRHYFIALITRFECRQTRALSQSQASLVIEWLVRRVREAEWAKNYFAGTAGRKGYPEHRRLPPSEAAWRVLWGCAAALGMSRSDLDGFIRRHYRRAGLQGIADLRTMADMNRVLWGLKAVLRRRGKTAGNCGSQRRAA